MKEHIKLKTTMNLVNSIWQRFKQKVIHAVLINRFKVKLFLKSDKFKSGRTKSKNSFFAILLGLVIGFIILGVWQANPFLFFGKTFQFALGEFKNTTLNLMVVYIFGGLAMALCFRCKYFNIGIPGQMLFSGVMTTIFMISMTKYNVFDNNPMGHKMNPAAVMIIASIIAITAGAIISGIAGLLKAYLHISEVVSTIMLNYSVFYFTKWIVVNHTAFLDPGYGGTKLYDNSFNFTVGGNAYLIPLLLALITTVVLAWICLKSTFGFKLKVVGSSLTVAHYNGIDINKTILQVSLLSGVLSGMMGLIFYNTYSPQILYNTTLLPTAGFTVIALTLIVYNDPILMVLAAFLWSIFKSGMAVAAFYPGIKISPEFSYMLMGIITYLVAANHMFNKFRPMSSFHTWYILKHSSWQQLKTMRSDHAKFRDKIQSYKTEIIILKKQLKTNVKITSLVPHGTVLSGNVWQRFIKRLCIPYNTFYQQTLVQLLAHRSQINQIVLDIKSNQAKILSNHRRIKFERQKNYQLYMKSGVYAIKNNYEEQLNKVAAHTLNNNSKIYETWIKTKHQSTRFFLSKSQFFIKMAQLSKANFFEHTDGLRVTSNLIHLHKWIKRRYIDFIFMLKKIVQPLLALIHAIQFFKNFKFNFNLTDIKQKYQVAKAKYLTDMKTVVQQGIVDTKSVKSSFKKEIQKFVPKT